MKYIDWSEEKNRILKESRNISFEEIVFSIENGQLLDVLEQQNKSKYPDQRLLIVDVKNYAYVVPFVEDDEKYYLKTIYPSRKATQKYLNKME
jgi:uncharacterized DUF497 family protein